MLHDIGAKLPATAEIAVLAIWASVAPLAAGYVIVLFPRNLVSRALRSYARAAGAVPDFVLGVGGIFLLYSVLRIVRHHSGFTPRCSTHHRRPPGSRCSTRLSAGTRSC